MNKQKKRAISRGKFERVMDMENYLDMDYQCDNWFSSGNKSCVCHADFIYWADHQPDAGTVKYFRKSLKEALS